MKFINAILQSVNATLPAPRAHSAVNLEASVSARLTSLAAGAIGVPLELMDLVPRVARVSLIQPSKIIQMRTNSLCSL